jgi:hypothetical protein
VFIGTQLEADESALNTPALLLAPAYRFPEASTAITHKSVVVSPVLTCWNVAPASELLRTPPPLVEAYMTDGLAIAIDEMS